MTLADLQSFGFTVATIMVIIVNLENALEIWYWTSLHLWFQLTCAENPEKNPSQKWHN
ncbi:unnamed protein product, partial [Rotaria sp. Silwood2]